MLISPIWYCAWICVHITAASMNNRIEWVAKTNKLGMMFCREKMGNECEALHHINKYRADSRLTPSQWETSLRSYAVSHWLGANLESSPKYYWYEHWMDDCVYINISFLVIRMKPSWSSVSSLELFLARLSYRHFSVKCPLETTLALIKGTATSRCDRFTIPLKFT